MNKIMTMEVNVMCMGCIQWERDGRPGGVPPCWRKYDAVTIEGMRKNIKLSTTKREFLDAMRSDKTFRKAVKNMLKEV